MVGDDDADILVFERGDDRLDVLHGDRVDAGEGFVEQDERRIDRHGAGDLRAAALAARKLDAHAFAHLLQAELLDERLDALGLILLRETGHFEYGADVVLDAQPAEDRSLLRQIPHAHLRAAVDRFVGQLGDAALVVFEEDFPLVRLYQPDDHVERGGLSRAVGPQQSDDLSLVDVDRDVVDDRAGFVFLDEFACEKAHFF